MIWYVLSAFLFSLALALLIFTRIREGRFLKRKASEVMRPQVFSELDDERIGLETRQKKFKAALDEASRGKR